MASDNIAVKLLIDLKRDFGLTNEQAAGVVGNLMHESGGFTQLQELSPTVPGSKGGFGYAQWTGPRRDAFEAYASDKGVDQSSYEANYGFLKHEIENDPYERRQFNTVKKATTAAEAAKLVSENFLRPGKPNLSSRTELANHALSYADSPSVASLLDTQRPSPTPAIPSQAAAELRNMTSPSGGNGDLQTALNAMALREGNRVTPAARQPQFGPMGTADVNSVYNGIFPQADLTSPGAVNQSVAQTRQEPNLAAALQAKLQPRAQSYAGQERGPVTSPVTASDRTRGSEPQTRETATTIATIPSRPQLAQSLIERSVPSPFSVDPGTPASGPVVATIPSTPASTIGQPPSTRTVQSVPVPAKAPVGPSNFPMPDLSTKSNPLTQAYNPLTPSQKLALMSTGSSGLTEKDIAGRGDSPSGFVFNNGSAVPESMLPAVGRAAPERLASSYPANPDVNFPYAGAAVSATPLALGGGTAQATPPMPRARPSVAQALVAAAQPQPVARPVAQALSGRAPLSIMVQRDPPPRYTPVQQLQQQGMSGAQAYDAANQMAKDNARTSAPGYTAPTKGERRYDPDSGQWR